MSLGIHINEISYMGYVKITNAYRKINRNQAIHLNTPENSTESKYKCI